MLPPRGTGLAVARQLEADADSAAMFWVDAEECQASPVPDSNGGLGFRP